MPLAREAVVDILCEAVSQAAIETACQIKGVTPAEAMSMWFTLCARGMAAVLASTEGADRERNRAVFLETLAGLCRDIEGTVH